MVSTEGLWKLAKFRILTRHCNKTQVSQILNYGFGYLHAIVVGNDFGSEAARLFLALGNKLRVRTNRDSNRAGNIGRVLKGWVPAGKPTYGYRYRKEIEPSSGATLRATM